MLYFAYGSNMDWKQIKKRCPSARFFCLAILKDQIVAFTRESTNRGCGVADIVPDEGHDVWGVVYQIDERDVGRLDNCEGYMPGRAKNGYLREERHVYEDGDRNTPLLVSTYIAVREDNPPPPSSAYINQLVAGARFWHLPEDYILELEEVETTA